MSKYTIMQLLNKVNSKIRYKIVGYCRKKKYYPLIYCSYWKTLFFKPKLQISDNNYFTAIPNQGAGIGHQLANWIAGYWFAKEFNLQFAHSGFSNSKWENFLGFGENEKVVKNLIKDGYRKVRLPLFDESNPNEVNVIKKIIAAYHNKKIVFVTEQDQSYKDQFGVIKKIKKKFYSSKSRKTDQFIYSNKNYNIAIHVRRGDIVIGQENGNSNLLLRWQGNEYFVNVLSNVIKNLVTNKPVFIYLFSQGKKNDFIEFENFKNFNYCLEMNAQDSFLHMVYADLLITSKSSFSYKPALLSNGIKVCPKDFWHGYPNTSDFILADNLGELVNNNSFIS